MTLKGTTYRQSGLSLLVFVMKSIQLGGHRFKNKPVRGYAIVDDQDYEEASKHNWYLSTIGYPVTTTNETGKKIYLHEFIIGKRVGFVIDHINHNRLDARRANLRHVTRSQNNMNKRVSGVTYKADEKRYVAQIKVNREHFYGGRYRSLEEAQTARMMMEVMFFGQYSQHEDIGQPTF